MGASQTVLPFKLAATDESLTAQSGLALYGEYLGAMGVRGLFDHELPGPGSAVGYSPSVHVLPLVLMLAGGGRTLEDLRVLRGDEGLRSLLHMDEMPSSDATGDWLRRMGAKESGGLAAIERVNRSVFRRLLRNDERTNYTLDIDATQIVAEKREARYTYKGEKGYMPLVGHIAETGLVIGSEFREGNAAPAAGNLEFLQACEGAMPKGKKISAMRADSAAYQAAIFNYCEETNKVFAIGADLDAAVKTAIAFRHAASSGTGFVRGQVALSLSRHRQQPIFKSLMRFSLASPRREYHSIVARRFLLPAPGFSKVSGTASPSAVVPFPKGAKAPGNHGVSGMAPPSRMMRPQRSRIADITFNWPRLTWPALALRHAGPWSRKISATSRTGRPTKTGVYAGGLLPPDFSGVRRSSGLLTSLKVLVATRV